MSSPRHKKGWETEKETSMLISEAFAVFVKNYIYIRGYAKSTHDNYRWAVESLIKVIEDIPIENLTLDHIVQWKQETERWGWDSNSVNSYMYKLRLFLRWWSRKHALQIDLDDLCIPKRKYKLVKYLSLDEVKIAFNACIDDRERLIIGLLYSTGVRVGELSRIRRQDVKGDSLVIRGKGGKERLVYLDSLAQELIQNYSTDSGFILKGYEGNLNKNTIEHIVRDISRRCGISFTPHTFRHTHATHLLAAGCNLRHIQELLGHAHISTTQIYTHVSNVDLAGAYKKYHVTLN